MGRPFPIRHVPLTEAESKAQLRRLGAAWVKPPYGIGEVFAYLNEHLRPKVPEITRAIERAHDPTRAERPMRIPLPSLIPGYYERFGRTEAARYYLVLVARGMLMGAECTDPSAACLPDNVRTEIDVMDDYDAIGFLVTQILA